MMDAVDTAYLVAAVLWLAQTILETLFTGKLEVWIRQIGLADDIEKLRFEIERVEMVVSAVNGRAMGNRPLARSLARLKELLYDADDAVDELDYYRLQRQIEGALAYPESADGHRAEQVERPRGNADMPSSSGGKKRSKAWRHFDITEEENGKPVKAQCIHCHKEVRCGSEKGTSVLHNHLKSDSCKKKRGASDQQPNTCSTADGIANGTPAATSDSSSRKRMRVNEESTHNTAANAHHWNEAEFSNRIKEITRKLQDIRGAVSEVLKLHGSDFVANSNQYRRTRSDVCPRTSSLIQRKIYGRVAEKNSIIKMIATDEYDGITVLPIVGIGGVGKTALAQLVYDDSTVKSQFGRIWVWVSDSFDEMKLTRELLDFVSQEKQEGISSFAKLQEILKGHMEFQLKRFLLILDDVWDNMDDYRWNKLLAPLKSSHAKGSVILVTTRILSVAQRIGTVEPINLGALADEDFWLLFKACAFGDENYDGHVGLSTIGRQIADKLKGNPLAAETAGALLRKHLTIDHWSNILKNEDWKSLQISRGIMPALKFSYDQLPYHLQQCFSYCSIFPNKYQFLSEELIHVWIAQGYVNCGHSSKRLEEIGQDYLFDLVNSGEGTSKRLEEIGMQYLDRLVDLGFFQKVDSHYVMHDLMHELAEKVSSNECANINGLQSKTIQPCIRHLSIITTAYDKDEHGNFPSENFEKILQDIRPLQKLRTLMFFGRSSVNLIRIRSFQILCKHAKSLRLLRIYVTGDDIDSVHKFIKPYHLRCLQFIVVCSNNIFAYENNEDIAFPEALTRFYHLQVFDVGMCNISKLPTGMNNLVNLRHLVAGVGVHSRIPSIGNMTALQELRKLRVQNASGFEIKQLQSMNKLVHLGISQLGIVKTKEEASRAKLIDKEHLENLWLSWDDSSMSLEPTTERIRDVLEGLEPHQNLKTLQITGYGGATYPTWLASNVSVTSLQTLRLENCRELRSLQSPEMLPLLRKLTLERMWNLMEVSIPSLEELVLIGMPKLQKCFGTYGLDLTSNLRLLMVKDCPQLNEFTLFHSDTFQDEQKSWFPSLDKLTIGRCPHIIKSEILPLEEMRSLKELELMDLHVVRVLLVPPLKKLVLIKMPSLESCSGLTASPPLQLSPSQGEQQEWVSSLRKLTIHDCPCLVVSHPLPPSDLLSELSIKGLSTFPTMKIDWRTLEIESSELSVLDGKILAFNNLKGTTSLRLQNCPNLVSIQSECFSQLIALEHLIILNCPDLLRSHIVSESVQENSTSANILVLPSLKYLEIWSCGIAGRWLTQMLPHLQSLEELRLRNCPQIKFLLISQPTETEATSSMASAATTSAGDELSRSGVLEMPCNLLRSLKRLSISRCLDLEFCGGKGGFGGFTSLVDLNIDDCPKLFSSLVGDDGVGLLPSSLQNLQIMDLPANLQSCFDKGMPYLKKLRLFSSPYLKCLQLHSCTALEELQIRGCKQLAVLEGLQYLHSLQSLDIEMNPELSAAWEQEQGGSQIRLFPSLNKLRIVNLTDGVHSRLLPCVPFITKLKLRDSPKLTSLQLGYCTALQELEITDCESLASIEGIQTIRNLRSLTVVCSPSLPACLELVSHQQGASEIWSRLETLEIDDACVLSMPLCKQLTSLRDLTFCLEGESMDMVSLTEEQESALQLLTSLQKLCFTGTNLLSLPANLRSLVSLETLEIIGCPSITRLPEMGLPPSLKYLWVNDCSEELRMQCRMAATEKLKCHD